MFYPPPLSTGEAGSFARYTFERRMPVMIDDVIAGNDYPADIVDALRALKAEVAGGVPWRAAPGHAFFRIGAAGLFGAGAGGRRVAQHARVFEQLDDGVVAAVAIGGFYFNARTSRVSAPATQ